MAEITSIADFERSDAALLDRLKRLAAHGEVTLTIRIEADTVQGQLLTGCTTLATPAMIEDAMAVVRRHLA